MSRWRYFVARVAATGPILLFAMTIVFLLLRFSPGFPLFDPSQPLWAQYGEFVIRVFTFDLTKSQVLYPGRDVYTIIAIYVPRSLWLWFWSVLFALAVGIPVGFYAGLNANTPRDYVASFGGVVWRSMPNFWVAVIVLTVFVQSRELLGFEWTTFLVSTNVVVTPDLAFLTRPLDALAEPREWWLDPANGGSFLAALKKTVPAALVLASVPMGDVIRLGRVGTIEAAGAHHVEVARAKGVTERALVGKHIARNALVPLLPIVTNGMYLLIGGSVFVEWIFNVQGLGFVFFEAAQNDALPFLTSLLVLFVFVVAGMNVLQDFLYVLVDPRAGSTQY